MISSDESDEEVSVQWPPQPRRPLRPAIMSYRPSHEHVLRRSSRHTVESETCSPSAEDEATEEVHSDSDYEDAARNVHSSRESITEDEPADRVLRQPHYNPESCRLRQYEEPIDLSRLNKSDGDKNSTGLAGFSKSGKYENQTSSVRYSKFAHYEKPVVRRSLHKDEVKPQHSKSPIILTVIVVIVIGSVYTMLKNQFDNDDYDDISNLPAVHSNRLDNYFERVLKDRIRDVKKKYPSQKDELWYQFLTGIKKVTRDEPTQPTTFLLLHTSDAKNTLRCLTKEIARTAANFLNASVPVTVDGEELREMHLKKVKASGESENNGWLIEKYVPQVKHSRAMILYDLEKVPATLAQAFHFFCDEVSPLVDKAVYLFTLGIPEYNAGRPMKVAEDRLNKLWGSDLSDDIRAPLLTRITGAVVYVLPERELPNPCS